MISANSHAWLVSPEVKFEARNGQKDGRDELKSLIVYHFSESFSLTFHGLCGLGLMVVGHSVVV